MRTLTIRQPWAWLILEGHKDVENRSWSTKFRGRFLIHAAAAVDPDYQAIRLRALRLGIHIPPAAVIERGGIVGAVTLIDVVTTSTSPWFEGPNAFVLTDPKRLPFQPMKGRLGWWQVERTGEI